MTLKRGSAKSFFSAALRSDGATSGLKNPVKSASNPSESIGGNGGGAVGAAAVATGPGEPGGLVPTAAAVTGAATPGA